MQQQAIYAIPINKPMNCRNQGRTNYVGHGKKSFEFTIPHFTIYAMYALPMQFQDKLIASIREEQVALNNVGQGKKQKLHRCR